MGEPCGMPRRLSRASVVRVFLPRSSVSSTAHSSHILIRLLDYEAAKEGLERGAKENFRLPPDTIPPVADSDPNYRGKHLQLTFTVEDEGVFTTPWSATITYGRPPMRDGRGSGGAEYVCAENPRYSGRK